MNKSFQDCGVDEDYFWSVLDQIGMRAYEDQCTPANPRIPLINDMKDIAVGAYYGVSQAEGHKLRIEREGEAATEEAPSVDCRRFVLVAPSVATTAVLQLSVCIARHKEPDPITGAGLLCICGAPSASRYRPMESLKRR